MKFGLSIIHSMVHVLVFTGPLNSLWMGRCYDHENVVAEVLGMAFGQFCLLWSQFYKICRGIVCKTSQVSSG